MKTSKKDSSKCLTNKNEICSHGKQPLDTPIAEDSQKQIANTQLVLVPLPIGELSWGWMNTPNYIDAIKPIMHWVAEDARTLRRFLSSLKVGIPLNDLDIFEFNVRTPKQELEKFFKDIKHSKLIGVASEAGMPCIADPGAVAVALAHQRGWDVKPIMGPNSLMLALAGSGLNGQTFTFHGYPPINENEIKQLTTLLNNKATDKHSHLFIETPIAPIDCCSSFAKTCPKTCCFASPKTSTRKTKASLPSPSAHGKEKWNPWAKAPAFS